MDKNQKDTANRSRRRKNTAAHQPDLPDPETWDSPISNETFIGFASVDDFDDYECCALCAMEREEVRNGAIVELHDFLIDFDEDELFE